MSRSALFGRAWAVSVDDGIEKRTWTDHEIEFSGHRTATLQPNEMELSIINLGPDDRAFVDRPGVNIELSAGYKGSLGQVFKGVVKFTSSSKEGTEHHTRITMKDGEIQWKYLTINKSFKKGTEINKVIDAIFKDITALPDYLKTQFQNINKAAQGKKDILPVLLYPKVKRKSQRTKNSAEPAPLPDQIKKKQEQLARNRQRSEAIKLERGKIVRGGAMKKLELFCRSFGLSAIWDEQTLHIVPDGAALSTEAIRIGEGSGQIGAAEKLEDGWRFQCLMQAELKPGHLVYLDDAEFQGLLLIQRIDYDAQSKGGDWMMKIEGREYDAS